MATISATITLLPPGLSLVHIPRHRVPQLSHPVLHQILRPNPSFLNITCNEIELTIFAEEDMLSEFEPVARKDRQRLRKKAVLDPIEVTYEKWRVLQIDSHNNQLENSGARVNDLSAPLAAAGISILYQSSYMSDFIFVKESRLEQAMSLFAGAGFDIYTADSTIPTVSSLTPPASPYRDMGNNMVLTRARSSTDPEAFKPKPKSHSPTAGEVNVLDPDLTCVGLSDENVDHWSLKIIKLVAFPDLIPSSSPESSPDSSVPLDAPRSGPDSRSPSPMEGSEGSACSSSDEDGYFSHSPSQNLSSSSLVTSAASKSFSDIQKAFPRSHRHSVSEGSSHSHSSKTSQSRYRPFSKHVISPLSPIVPTPSTKSVNDPQALAAVFSLPSVGRWLPFRSRTHSLPLTHAESSQTQQRVKHAVPFFSFTRTPEGSSLTASVEILASLFPPNERYMVLCGSELDACDERKHALNDDDVPESLGSMDGEENLLKCLQIDLRRFGLDKHGLVNRFSRSLEENGINHMYSSTFKTANLLVEKRHARRAQNLLRSC